MPLEKKAKIPAIKSNHCGDLYEVQDGKNYQCSVVYSPNMQSTSAHFHTNMDEQYVVGIRRKYKDGIFNNKEGRASQNHVFGT